MSVLLIFIIIIVLILYMTCPSLRKHQDKNLMNQMFIAHRGLHCLGKSIPENSLPAFEEAVKKNYPIEIDIHLTADKQVVVFHDDTFKRMCSVDEKPEEMSLSDIKRLRLSGTGEYVPTLKECLDCVSGTVPLLIEFKCGAEGYKELCVEADKILEKYNGKYFIQSFYPPVLYWYRKNRKAVLRGQLSSKFKNKKNISFLHRVSGCLMFNFVGRPDFIAYEYKYPNAMFRKLNILLGAGSAAWTFRNKAEFEKYGKYYKTYIFEGFEPENQFHGQQ